jgi:hypothetical protein
MAFVHLCNPKRELVVDVTDHDLFCASIRQQAHCGPGQLLILTDTNGTNVNASNFSVCVGDGTHLVCFFSQHQKLSEAVEMQVAITPHVNILIHGGDEYDFEGALSELIDNSISATMGNTHEGRVIRINFWQHQEGESPCLEVSDNGRGMTMQGLSKWATMGDTEEHIQNDVAQGELYLSSAFSRYGVGSKKVNNCLQLSFC